MFATMPVAELPIELAKLPAERLTVPAEPIVKVVGASRPSMASMRREPPLTVTLPVKAAAV